MAGGVQGPAGNGKRWSADFLRSALIHRSLAEFREFTGLSAKLIPARLPLRTIRFGEKENDFCRAMLCAGVCRRVCYQTQTRLLRRLENKLKPQQVHCLGGIVHMAVPVLVKGRHVATILGGRVRLAPARAADAGVVERLLASRATPASARSLRALYRQTPMMTREKIRTAIRLLDVLARLFEEVIAHQPPPRNGVTPQLTKVHEFVQQHLQEHLTTREAAAAVQLSEAYFCRLFQRITGTTFHAYVAGLRTEAAKAALEQTTQRISDIAMAAGFQSVSDFNRVFKANTGMTPSAFRARCGAQ